MKMGLKGNLLPHSEEDFAELLATGKAVYTKCIFNGCHFPERTHTVAGWRETQISGSCEDCFDNLFKDSCK